MIVSLVKARKHSEIIKKSIWKNNYMRRYLCYCGNGYPNKKRLYFNKAISQRTIYRLNWTQVPRR